MSAEERIQILQVFDGYIRSKISANYFMETLNSWIGIAGKFVILTLPRNVNSVETRTIVLLSGASTILTMSYVPKTAYWLIY